MLQLDLFEDRAQTTSLTHLMLGEILEAGPRKLKDALNDLNRLLKQASESDSLFGASTKEDILKDVLEQNGYNIDKLRKAYEQRRQATRQATEGAVDGGHPGREDTAGRANGADTGTKDQTPESPSNPSSVGETEGEVTPGLPKGENPVPHAAVPQPPQSPTTPLGVSTTTVPGASTTTVPGGSAAGPTAPSPSSPHTEASPQSSPRRSPVSVALRSALERILNRKGLLGDWEEGQKILDTVGLKDMMLSKGHKKTIETAPLNQKEDSSADISTVDNAKVQKKWDSLANELEKVANRRKKFIFCRLLY